MTRSTAWLASVTAAAFILPTTSATADDPVKIEGLELGIKWTLDYKRHLSICHSFIDSYDKKHGKAPKQGEEPDRKKQEAATKDLKKVEDCLGEAAGKGEKAGKKLEEIGDQVQQAGGERAVDKKDWKAAQDAAKDYADGNDEAQRIEGVYKQKIDNRMILTPGVIWIMEPYTKGNNDVIVGALRPTFKF